MPPWRKRGPTEAIDSAPKTAPSPTALCITPRPVGPTRSTLSAKAGSIDRALLPGINSAIQGLRVTLQDNVYDLTPSQHIESKRYLGYLDDSVKARAI